MDDNYPTVHETKRPPYVPALYSNAVHKYLSTYGPLQKATSARLIHIHVHDTDRWF